MQLHHLLFLFSLFHWTSALLCNQTTSILCQGTLSSNHSICIQRSSVCDGIIDCHHAIDEQCRERNPMFTCSIDEYACPLTHRCIPHQWKCNGRNDCQDIYASDELNCSLSSQSCNADEFTCEINHQCVPSSAKCDGIRDCLDQSDESASVCLRSSNFQKECSNDEYPCQSTQLCLPRSNQCDTISQCHDRTDEMSCSCPLDDYLREKYFFFCSRTNQCLPKDLSCDVKRFCQSDLSPDDPCSSSCAPNGTCSSIESKSCPQGYRINERTGQCEDIDECDESVRCDQFCRNTPGSYQCACEEQYRLRSDKHTCTLRTSEKPFTSMLGILHDGIYRWTQIDPFLNNRTLIFPINHTYLMDYDPMENTLYLVQCAEPLRSHLRICSKTKGLFRVPLIDGNPPTAKMIIDGNVYSSIHSMAIDWLHGNIYFVNIDSHTIHICRLDGRFCRILLQPKLVDYYPLHLILYPEKGFLFYTSVLKSRTQSIVRVTLDGQEMQVFSTMKIDQRSSLQPSLAMDPVNHHLYFYNGQDRIFIFDLSGKIRHVQYQNDEHFHGMKIFQDKIYRTFPHWDLRSTSELYINAKYALTTVPFTNNDYPFHRIDVERYFLHLIDFLFLYRSVDTRRDHRCEQFYFPDPSDQTKKICRCTDEMILSDDGYTCQPICPQEFSYCSTSKQCLSSNESCHDLDERPPQCSDLEFLCDGECISIDHRCDQQPSCYDGADEGAVCRQMTCPKDYFKCLPSGKCISSQKVCDQVEDCPMSDRVHGVAMDETIESCSGNRSISEHRNRTVPAPSTCEAIDLFRCKTVDMCINQSYICDGHPDCEDSSDEEHCSNMADHEIYLSFSLHQDFTCMYGYRCMYERIEPFDQLPLCVSLHQLCDGIQQCPLGDDEHPRRCQHHCTDCDSTSSVCELVNYMPICQCKTGFIQLINGTCVEADRLPIALYHRCTHLLRPRSICQCDQGYTMTIQDSHASCIAKNTTILEMMLHPRAFFFFNQSGAIIAPVHASHQVIDAMLVPTDDHWYLLYTEQRNGRAYLWRQRFDLIMSDGTAYPPTQIWSSSIYSYTIFTVDWIHRLIYLHYSDPSSSLNGIEILYSNTTHYQSLVFITRLIFSNTKTISSINVDPFQGYLYISAYHDAQHSLIYRSFLDGSNVEVLLRLHYPILSLTVDYRHPSIYLLLSNGDIESYTFDGSSAWKTTLYEFRQVRPYAVTLYDDLLSVMVFNHTDTTYDEIWLDKFGRTMVHQNRKWKNAMLIRYIHPFTYPTMRTSNTIQSNCSSASCPLDQICISTPIPGTLCIKPGITVPCQTGCHHRGICANDQCICSNRSYSGKHCQLCRLADNFHAGCFDEIDDNQGSCLCYLSRSKTRRTPYLCTTWKFDRGEIEIPCDLILSPIPRDRCLSTVFNETICQGPRYALMYHVQSQTCICREVKNRRGICWNNGLLILNDQKNPSNCSCSFPYSGSQCQYHACTDRCENNGTCYLNGTTLGCHCPSGVSGERCEQNICQSIQCENNGKCFVENNQPICFCSSHFTGLYCQHRSHQSWQSRLLILLISLILFLLLYHLVRSCLKRLQWKSLFSHHHLHESTDFDLNLSRIIYTHVPNQDQELFPENQFSNENDGFLHHEIGDDDDDQRTLPDQIFRQKH